MKMTLTIIKWKLKNLILIKTFYKDLGSANNKNPKISLASLTKDTINLMKIKVPNPTKDKNNSIKISLTNPTKDKTQFNELFNIKPKVPS